MSFQVAMEKESRSDLAPKSRLDGMVALITGGASGLGLEVARLFCEHGAKVVMVDWDSALLEHAVQGLTTAGFDAVGLSGDVSVPETAGAAVAEAVNRHGHVDMLFNNAGIDPVSATNVLETSVDDWDRMMAVNVRGAYLFCRAAIPQMVSRGGGTIVNTASVAGLHATSQETAYSVSKHALVGLTRCVAVDFAAAGIRCNCICPGGMEMPMLDRRGEMSDEQVRERNERIARASPVGRLPAYAEVAQSVLFLAGPDSHQVNGVALIVDGGRLGI
jgi:NAD(P)-dependent dehydrogenase (short-subunit alcohol dehydrogenase family)